MCGLTDDLQDLPDDSIAVQSFKETVKAVILKRWNVEEILSILVMSTALDPRFKFIKYLDEDTKAEVTELITSNTERLVGDIEITMEDSDCTFVDDTQCTLKESCSHSLSKERPSTTKKQKVSILLGPEEDTRGKTIKDEVETYFHEKVCARKINVLEWWKISKHITACKSCLLSSLFQLRTLTPSKEAIFHCSTNKRRTCLNPENVDVILFLKNLKVLIMIK